MEARGAFHVVSLTFLPGAGRHRPSRASHTTCSDRRSDARWYRGSTYDQWSVERKGNNPVYFAGILPSFIHTPVDDHCDDALRGHVLAP